jgi:GT2 family glycosyltransferase
VIADFQASHPGLAIQVTENPRQSIPAALNTAIRACRGDYVVRLDGHSVPAVDYVERSVAALEERLGAVVGGVWQIQPGGMGWAARAIAAAAANPLGVGDALYRFTTRAGQVDTVPFGAYARALIDQVGFYDETLLVNEDYEFNTRVRQSGGKVWLDPAIHSVYFARSDLAALSRQYFRYGFWKFRMLRRYPGTLRWRQALPPIFLLNLVLLAVLAIFLPLAGLGLGLELGLYALILLAAGIQQASKRKDRGLVAGIPLAIATMHLSWGWGFLVSVVKSGLTK